jgi:hypothetical protein
LLAGQISPTNNIATLGALGTQLTNLGALGTEITNLNNIRTDITGVNNINSQVLDLGDLYFDTASNTMKVYSSGGWINAGSSVKRNSRQI